MKQLIKAAKDQDWSKMEELLQGSSSRELIAERGDLGETALHWVARHGHCDMIERLIFAGCPYDAKDERDQTALDWARGSDKTDKVLNRLESNLGSLLSKITEEVKDEYREALTGLNLNQMLRSISESFSPDFSHKVEKKPTVFIVGRTGQGKSAFLGYQLGYKLTFKTIEINGHDKDVVDYENLKDLPVNHPVIGHGRSETKGANRFSNDGSRYDYVDCGGLFDTSGAEADICNAMAVAMQAQAKPPLAIIMVINSNDILQDRGQGILNLIERLRRSVKNPTEGRVWRSIFFLVNDSSPMYDARRRRLLNPSEVREKLLNSIRAEANAQLDRCRELLRIPVTKKHAIIDKVTETLLPVLSTIQDETTKEEVQEKLRNIQILNLLSINPENIIVANLLDEGETRDILLKSLGRLRAPLSLNQFNIDNLYSDRVPSPRLSFNATLMIIASYFNRLQENVSEVESLIRENIEYTKECERDLQEHRQTISEYEQMSDEDLEEAFSDESLDKKYHEEQTKLREDLKSKADHCENLKARKKKLGAEVARLEVSSFPVELPPLLADQPIRPRPIWENHPLWATSYPFIYRGEYTPLAFEPRIDRGLDGWFIPSLEYEFSEWAEKDRVKPKGIYCRIDDRLIRYGVINPAGEFVEDSITFESVISNMRQRYIVAMATLISAALVAGGVSYVAVTGVAGAGAGAAGAGAGAAGAGAGAAGAGAAGAGAGAAGAGEPVAAWAAAGLSAAFKVVQEGLSEAQKIVSKLGVGLRDAIRNVDMRRMGEQIKTNISLALGSVFTGVTLILNSLDVVGFATKALKEGVSVEVVRQNMVSMIQSVFNFYGYGPYVLDIARQSADAILVMISGKPDEALLLNNRVIQYFILEITSKRNHTEIQVEREDQVVAGKRQEVYKSVYTPSYYGNSGDSNTSVIVYIKESDHPATKAAILEKTQEITGGGQSSLSIDYRIAELERMIDEASRQLSKVREELVADKKGRRAQTIDTLKEKIADRIRTRDGFLEKRRDLERVQGYLLSILRYHPHEEFRQLAMSLVRRLNLQNSSMYQERDLFSRFTGNRMLRIRNFLIHRVPGDGNCLFHALADQLQQLGVKDECEEFYTHETLRALVASHIAARPELAAFITVDEREGLGLLGGWVGEESVQILADLLRIQIKIIQDQRPSPINDVIRGDSDKVACLLYTGAHYDSLRIDPDYLEKTEKSDEDTLTLQTPDDEDFGRALAIEDASSPSALTSLGMFSGESGAAGGGGSIVSAFLGTGPAIPEFQNFIREYSDNRDILSELQTRLSETGRYFDEDLKEAVLDELDSLLAPVKLP